MAGLKIARTCAAALAAVALAALLATALAQAPTQGFYTAPYVQNAAPNGITIMWETPAPAASAVAYGPAAGPGYPQTATDAKQVKIHKVRISGLKPDAAYRYHVRAGDATHEATFRTAPARVRPIRFAVLGDTRFWGTKWETSGFPRHMMAQKPEFTLHLGDLVSRGHQYELWPDHFRRFAYSMKHIPMYVARGNHEDSPTEYPHNNWFTWYHDLPGGEPFSSFDWGNVHVSIASYVAMGEAPTWLDKDLAATDRPWKIVAFHYPVYCTGYMSGYDKRKASGNPELEAVFDKHNVDMVAVGHTHIYERSFALRGGKRDDRNGTVYLVSAGGIGGQFPDWWDARIALDCDFPHYSMVECTDSTMEIRSYALQKGTVGDTARIIEIDHCIRWRDEALPKERLAELETATGPALLSAIEALGAMIYEPAAPQLVRLLASKDTAVRHAAALALERIGTASVAAQLIPYLDDEDAEVAGRAARTLEEAMPPELAQRIAPMCLDQKRPPAVRVALLGALRFHAPALGRQAALALLSSGEPDGIVRDRAVEVFKRTATEEDMPVLLDMVRKETREYVVASAAWGLNRLTGADVDAEEVSEKKPDERGEYIRAWTK